MTEQTIRETILSVAPTDRGHAVTLALALKLADRVDDELPVAELAAATRALMPLLDALGIGAPAPKPVEPAEAAAPRKDAPDAAAAAVDAIAARRRARRTPDRHPPAA